MVKCSVCGREYCVCALRQYARQQYVQGGQRPVTRTSGSSIRIFWDVQVGAYRMVAPFHRNFIDLLKTQIPSSDRSWDNQTKIWTFSEKWLPPIEKLIESLFGAKPSVVTKETASSASVPPSVSTAKLPSLQDRFFELVPYNSMRKAYLLAMNEVHPDKGGDASKASELNAVWQQLEKEFYAGKK